MKKKTSENGNRLASADIPIYQAGENIPDGQPYYYILGQDGIFLHKTTRFYAATVQVDGIGGLGKVKEQLVLAPNFKKIPWGVIKEALDFFRAVYAKHHSEGIVLLGFNKKKEEWFLIPVEQEVQGAHVDYKVNGSRGAVGTIHSHPSFAAFYSSTDDHDDKQLDGIHIVLGQITEDMPKIEVSAMVNGNRFEFKPEQIVANIPKPKKENKTHEWIEKFVKKKTYQAPEGYGRSGVYKRYPSVPIRNKDSQLALLDDDEVERIISRNKSKKKEEANPDPFADLGTGGKKQEFSEETETDYAAECHFTLVKQEADNLGIDHLEELVQHIEERLDLLENRDFHIGMGEEEDEGLVMDQIYCPMCGRKTDFAGEKTRWCASCRMQIKPGDCVIPNLDGSVSTTCSSDADNILNEKPEKKLDKKCEFTVEPYRDDERVYCRVCHTLTAYFTDEKENDTWRWCPRCGQAVSRHNMLSLLELRAQKSEKE